MKKQIRRGVFETNSSSTHSITMMMKEDYDKWEKENLYLFDGNGNHFPKECRPEIGKMYTKEEVIDFLKAHDRKYEYEYFDYENNEEEFDDVRRDEEFKLIEEGNEYLEGYYKEFTTPSGETVVAFGEYGYEG
jgi:hypothetical protein